MVIKLPRSRESTPVAVTTPSTTLEGARIQRLNGTELGSRDRTEQHFLVLISFLESWTVRGAQLTSIPRQYQSLRSTTDDFSEIGFGGVEIS